MLLLINLYSTLYILLYIDQELVPGIIDPKVIALVSLFIVTVIVYVTEVVTIGSAITLPLLSTISY